MSDKKKDVVQESIPPMGLRMIAREFKKERENLLMQDIQN